MNFPDFTFWSHLLATVGIEVCCLAALGLVAQYFVRSAVWQRAIWQTTVICLLLLPMSEWTGFGRGAAGFLFGHKPVVENVPASGFTAFKSSVVVEPVAAKLNSPAPLAARPAMWWPAWIWLAGAALVLGRMAAAQVLLLALRWRREKIATQSLRQRVANVASSVGLRRKVSLLRMPESISPMAFGILRPSIGLPPAFEAKLSVTEQEAVLAHELAHLAAMDPLWFLLADFASAWLWWHPLTWWVRHSLHASAELAADEATSIVPDGPGALANCLVNLGKQMTAARGWSWVGINGGFRSGLGKRVERLMRMSRAAKRPSAGRASTAAILAATIVVVPTIVLLIGSFQSAHAQKAENWQSQLRQSWNSSPGGRLLLAASDNSANQKAGAATWVENARLLYEKDELLLLAALDDKPELKAHIAAWITKAKLLYENGKYDDAEAVLAAVMKEDHANQSAAYYLDLIKEARYTSRARQLEEGTKNLPLPAFHTNLVYTSNARQDILAKLGGIVIEKVNYDLPLKDVLLQLRNESKKRDPDGVGVNFIIDNGAFALADATPPSDVGQVRIKISPPQRNLRLADVLDAVTMVADSPIRYTVKDYAVVFSPKPPDTIPVSDLHTGVFRLDPTSFLQSLKKVYTSNPIPPETSIEDKNFEVDDGLRRSSDEHDDFGGPVDPRRFGLNDVTRTNETVATHQLIVAYFASLGMDVAPPKAIFFNDRLGLLLVRATLQDLDTIQHAIETLLNPTPPRVRLEARFTEVDESALQKFALDWNKHDFTGVLTAAQFRLTLAAIQQRFGADVLTAPTVVTESGRQAHLGSSNKDGGVMLDVLPVVGSDGYFIQTTAMPVIKTAREAWQAKASRQVFDGETMVIGAVVTNQLSAPIRVRVVFVTPRIIDPVGQPLHTDDQLSKSLELLNP